jgi:DNA (cytosine-5)-methyltransferase 1
MSAYYNEYDPKAAAWLRQLIKNGLIADGDVDERSITEVEASDIRRYTQHHFFAGIGGWSYALRLAGWADDKPVCTASLPCQPFSVAGAGKGKDDERHLLPHFIELVKQCNFRTIFGEQVPAAIKHGWLDDLCFEMERENYAVGSIVLTAAGAGAPHIRQRLYWVADSNNKGSQGRLSGWQDTEREAVKGYVGCSGTVGRVSNTENGYGRGESQLATSNGRESRDQFRGGGSCSGAVYPNGAGSQQGREFTEVTGYRDSIEPTGDISRMGNTEHNGRPPSEGSGSDASAIYSREARANISSELKGAGTPALVSEWINTEWTNPEWLYCRDDKWRPIKPGVKPLVDGVPRRVVPSNDRNTEALEIDCENTQEARVMRLKGYGNAIVPQVAAQFIKAFMNV